METRSIEAELAALKTTRDAEAERLRIERDENKQWARQWQEETDRLNRELAALRSGGEAELEGMAIRLSNFDVKSVLKELRTAYAMGKAAGREPLEHALASIREEIRNYRTVTALQLIDAALTPASEPKAEPIPGKCITQAEAVKLAREIQQDADKRRQEVVDKEASATDPFAEAKNEFFARFDAINADREKVLEAFIAEHAGIKPSEIEQVIQVYQKETWENQQRWFIRRRTTEPDGSAIKEKQPAMTSELIKRADEFIAKHRGKNYRDMGEMAKAVALVDALKAAIQPAPMRELSEGEREDLSTSVVDDYRKTAGTVRVIDLYVIARRAIDATVRKMRGE